MKGVRDRTAEFRCALAYFDGHRLKVFLGRKRGRISDEPRGRGWGFDPIFVPSGSTLTYAELGEEKNRVSHRRLAANKLARWLKSR
jgi:XTP/dITP diphosphohydrolase